MHALANYSTLFRIRRSRRYATAFFTELVCSSIFLVMEALAATLLGLWEP